MTAQPALANCPGSGWIEVGWGKTYPTIMAAVAGTTGDIDICVYNDGPTTTAGPCGTGEYDEAVHLPGGRSIGLRAFDTATCIHNTSFPFQPAVRIDGGTTSKPSYIYGFANIWGDTVTSDGIQVRGTAVAAIENNKAIIGSAAGTSCTASFHMRPATAPEPASLRLIDDAVVLSFNNAYDEGCHGVVGEGDSLFDSTNDDFGGVGGWPFLFEDRSYARIHRGEVAYNTTHIGGVTGWQLPAAAPRFWATDTVFHHNPPAGKAAGTSVEGFVVEGPVGTPVPVEAVLFNGLFFENRARGLGTFQSGLVSGHGLVSMNLDNLTMADNSAWAHVFLADPGELYWDDSIVAGDPADFGLVNGTWPGLCVVDEIGWWNVSPGDFALGASCAAAQEVNNYPDFRPCPAGSYCLDQLSSPMRNAASELVTGLPLEQQYLYTDQYYTSPLGVSDPDIDELDFGFHRWP